MPVCSEITPIRLIYGSVFFYILDQGKTRGYCTIVSIEFYHTSEMKVKRCTSGQTVNSQIKPVQYLVLLKGSRDRKKEA